LLKSNFYPFFFGGNKKSCTFAAVIIN